MSAEICSRCSGEATANAVHLASLRKTCFDFLLSTWDERLAGCLDALDSPAAIVAGDYTVLLSNRRLGPGLGALEGEWSIGELIGCANAVEPSRCGQGSACVHCGIRKAVDHTLATGEKVYRYPVTFPTRRGAEEALVVVTMKAADGVVTIFEAGETKSVR